MTFQNDSNTKKIEAVYKAALELHLLEQFCDAIVKYLEVLSYQKNHINACLNLSEVYYITEQYEAALITLLEGLKLNTNNPELLYMYGLVLEKNKKKLPAIFIYKKIIKLNSDFIGAYNNLGNLFFEIGQPQQAEKFYLQAIKIAPQHFGAYLNLGNLQMHQQQIDDAIETYTKALELNPKNTDVLYNLGFAFQSKKQEKQAYFYLGSSFYYNKDYAEAISYYQKYLKFSDQNQSVYVALADCYRNINQYQAASEILEQAIEMKPHSEELYFQAIVTRQLAGQTEEAIAIAEEAIQLFPESLSLKLEAPRILPIVYRNPEEIEFYRQRFIQGLNKVSKKLSLDTEESKKKAMLGTRRFTNFYINYQGKNDLELQKNYGNLLHQIMAANYPHWIEPLSHPPLTSKGKIRVGYISNCMRNHSAAKTRLGWLRHSDRDRFELYCYYTARPTDSFTKLFQIHSDVFHHIPSDLERVCQQIIDDRLHILVFLDIGMHPLTMQIAALRLAPIQCVGWVHPVTTGLPTIDYFISNELMEPENAEEHYSEKLIRLPNIGISYAKPLVPKLTKTRANFQLKQESIVYLCCQSLFKYLPQHDYIWGEIAQKVPQAQFVFLSHTSAEITKIFQCRLQQTFEKFGLNWQEYCIVLPRQNQLDYWQLNLLSDIYLDNLSWSGCNTTLEAIACDLPVVTCPGKLMRGRHAYGILKMLNVTDTIARTIEEYIAIAVNLALDTSWRNSVICQIHKRHDDLYEDLTCVQGLEAFYQSLEIHQYC
jgi:protein O-GlcNAc transferase